jgi:hypothetical protein
LMGYNWCNWWIILDDCFGGSTTVDVLRFMGYGGISSHWWTHKVVDCFRSCAIAKRRDDEDGIGIMLKRVIIKSAQRGKEATLWLEKPGLT